MPVIFQKENIKFSVHAKDHNPPHVHIDAPGASLVVNIKTFEVTAASGFKMYQIKDLVALVKEKQEILMTEWEKYHA